jgi:hypothetical protein
MRGEEFALAVASAKIPKADRFDRLGGSTILRRAPSIFDDTAKKNVFFREQRTRACDRAGSWSQISSLDKSDLIAFQDKTRQSSGRVGAGIDIDPVRPNVGLQDGSVPMHDDLAKVVLAKEKIFSYPE